MLKEKLNWRRPLFYVLLPIFFVMAFLGFPLPVAPPPATKPAQEQAAVIKKKKKKIGLVMPEDQAGKPDGA
ncbi:hypothetical protein B0920_15555 [Massilia sp. KIM]|uniref:hypothetical protein n=1 Tax=Massilia sp. KIM TaxID=1955422 RepID=UPI00098F06A6|nr:hypothetical protein [Massilia sp. KIM]OON60402.1 hypothetical protein B0920_15555 [Massilia sp. KIM]